MENFNIKEAGSELEKILKKELGTGGTVRLTIDVQIPEYLRGDKLGFHSSIIQIYSHLNKYIINLSIDIELLKASQYVGQVRLNINVMGFNPQKQIMREFFTLRQNETYDLLKVLPYPTTFTQQDKWACFSFSMTFHYSAQSEGVLNLFRNKKVLLVEENELSALVFTSFMEEWGCHVTRISSGLHVTEEVSKTLYNVILINVHAAEMHGIDAIREIRTLKDQIPIIGLSSSWSNDETSPAYAAGANEILAKPASSEELKKILTRYF
jgi:CheY-like chemotaxis protein